MSLIRHCDKCGEPIDTEGILSDRSWVNVAVALDDDVRDSGQRRDYHRSCARTVTIAEAWSDKHLVAL